MAPEDRVPKSGSVPGSAPGRGGRWGAAGNSHWAPGGGAVLGWRSGGGCRKPGALGCGGGWCRGRSAGPAPFGKPPPSGPPPPRPRPRPRLRPRPAPGARSKPSDMLLRLLRGPLPLHSGEDAGEAPRAGCRRCAHACLMEEEGGRPLLGSSALQAKRTAAGAPTAPSARPSPLASAFRFPPEALFPRPQRAGGEGGSQRPPAARRPQARQPRRLSLAAGGQPRPSWPPGEQAGPLDGLPPRAPGGGVSGPGAGLEGKRDAYPGLARPTRWFSGENCETDG